MVERDEIFRVVRGCVSKSLEIDEEAVRLDSRLINDLGADSLDFLDIVFSLEESFGLKLRNADLDLLTRGEFAGVTNEDGYLPPETVAHFRRWLPALRLAPPEQQISPRDIYSYITAETLVILVEKKLGSSADE
ncbi:MAG TPA: phosphopantetheine-binding protein [Pyrinomonadaceae bacterium]|jgi:acyl carrier protein|nr:phosphopantetheine-binding protein [Pyrinomonadaceae bacterium]